MSDIVDRILELKASGINSGEELLRYSKERYLELSTSSELDLEDVELGRLDWSPKSNWVQDNGGLPRYVEEVSIGIMKSGKTREQAIPIAISRIKRWAAGLDGVTKKTQMKSVAALAQWEKMKASARAKRLAKRK